MSKRLDIREELRGCPTSDHDHLSVVLSLMALDLAGAHDMESIAHIARNATQHIWSWDAFMLSIRRSGHDRFRTVLVVDTVDGNKQEFPSFDYDARIYKNLSSILHFEPVHAERAEPEKSYRDTVAFGNRDRKSASLLYAPLVLDQEVGGVLSVQSYTPHFFSENDCRTLQAVADVLAPAVMRCRAEKRTELVAELGHNLNSAQTSEDAAAVIAQAADELMGWDACSIEVLSPDEQMLHTIMIYDTIDGQRISDASKDVYAAPTPMARKALVEGGQLLLRTPEELVAPVQILHPFGDKQRRSASLMFVAIRSGSRAVGLMSIQSYTPWAYSELDLRFLEQLADHCGGAIERVRVEQGLRESEEMHRLLVENVNDGVVISQNEIFVYYNRQFALMLGYDSAELQTRNFRDVYTPRGVEILYSRAAARQRGEEVPSRYETTFRRKDGTDLDVEANVTIIANFRGAVATFAVIRDMTQRKLDEQALRQSEERYALAVRGANDGLWDWNLREKTVYLSPRWKGIIGYSDEELLSTLESWFDRVHPDDIRQLKSDIHAHLEQHTKHFENEHRIHHRDGSWRWMLTRGMSLFDSTGMAYRIAGSQSDITARKAAEEELLHGAYHDSLTGLPNRAHFQECLVRSIALSQRRSKYMFAVLFLDLDRFKVVNDSLGHMVGDQLLVAVARKLAQCIRPGDAIARLGGDEFTILLDDINDIGEATKVAERIQKELLGAIDINGNDIYTTASIGIASSNSRYIAPEHVLRDADIAMYRAKAMGKSRYQIFDRGMHEKAIAQLELEMDLRRAIERREFMMVYQPIVQMSTGNVCGFEALIRWNHPKRGMLLPSDFILVAEETGLIVPIGFWVIDEVSRQSRQWRPHLPLPISVNLSGRQFAHPQLIDDITLLMRKHEVPSYALTMEITENVVMENAETFIGVLAKLKKLDLQLQIDDFGTGYSSLSYLQKLPVDVLKIDRSFVSALNPEGDDLEIVRVIVNLAHTLRMKVIAEGVETQAQVNILRELGCEFAQGYYFHHPMSPEEAEKLLLAAANR